jgi:hypothetical protein
MRLYCFIKGVSFAAFAKTISVFTNVFKIYRPMKNKDANSIEKLEIVLLLFLKTYAQT